MKAEVLYLTITYNSAFIHYLLNLLEINIL